MTFLETNYHVGRAWNGHEIEDHCPCFKAPCGLAIVDPETHCDQHFPEEPYLAKTLRQIHSPDQCPGAP